ncbi:hypothetical protein COL154_005978 [Colletotrichum chrysophilum]|uniref:uncharacterized protein n=1 Tax=Colletotrichum chrysophilum TaxID=1836956 RepID=UPI002300C02E|nr:uncharacterized protein COL26b_012039 [Colletotrichum chrysophilum]KAJ0341911.1 hypothetical protein KNSL1_010909 [Colletotrichum chrysophilum]KAJ0362797.1 hypothetical protein COL154_005978 [Colletotrichum chrysophilum]KAJ0365466.1 hypothetical protein COL26b_012039 [Colletotrichum chrysophilum]
MASESAINPRVPSLDGKLILFGNVNIVPDHYDDWQAAYDDLATYVFAKEPNTTTYYFGLPLEYADNPSRTPYLFAFEIYSSREDLYDVHLKSETMTTSFLPAALPVMATGLDLVHYDVAGGFLDRSDRKAECGIMEDTQIRCTDSAARAEVLGALKMLCRAAKDDDDVFTFLALRGQDDEISARIFARFRDRDSMERWARTEVVKGFWEIVKNNVKDMGSRAYVPNGKGWLWK